MNYYDKTGKAITMIEWTELFERNDYRIIKQEKIAKKLISTVWLGLDHNFDSNNIHIFETMVFNTGKELDQVRYSTLEEAIKGHKEIVNKYKRKSK